MQSSVITRKPAKTLWAVVPSWTQGRSKRESTIESCDRAVKVSIVNHKHYARSGNTYQDSSRFYVTDDRSYGFLVSFINAGGEETYAVIPPQHFVAEWSEYDAYWTPERERRRLVAEENERLRQENAQKQQRRWDIEKERKQAIEVETNKLAESIRESAKVLLGARAEMGVSVSPRIEGEWRNLDTEYETYVVTKAGMVSVEMNLFQRLLEMAMDAKEL